MQATLRRINDLADAAALSWPLDTHAQQTPLRVSAGTPSIDARLSEQLDRKLQQIRIEQHLMPVEAAAFRASVD